MNTKLKLLSLGIFLLTFTSCKSQENNLTVQTDNTEQPIAQPVDLVEISTEQNKTIVDTISNHSKNPLECITEEQAFAYSLPKVENNIDGELDYTKNELSLTFAQVNRDETIVGKIAKDGTIHFSLPEIDIKDIHHQINMYPASLESMFSMQECKGKDVFAKSKYDSIYSHKYDLIFINKYGVGVAYLTPVSSKEVLKNNHYSNDTLHKGSQYYFYNIDKNITFNEQCIQNSFSGIYNIELERKTSINFKKGWNFIKETLVEIQAYKNGDYQGQIPKEITYSNANFKNNNIKWYIKRLADEDEILLAKKIFYLTPLTQYQFEQWTPKKLKELPLIKSEYGNPPEGQQNKNNLHLIYANEAQKREIELYVVDCAKNIEDLLMTNNVYAMEVEYGEDKTPKPYVAQYNERENTTKLLYKVNDRIVVNATGVNMTPEELWAYIKKLNVEKLIP